MKKSIIIDAGSTDLKIYDIINKKIYKEKNFLAYRLEFDFSNVQVHSRNLYAYGNDAFEYFDRCPNNIEVVQCILNNKVIDIEEQSLLINKVLKKYNINSGFSSSRSYILTSKLMTNFEKDAKKKSTGINSIKEINVEDILSLSPEVKERPNSIIISIGQDNSFIITTHYNEILFVKNINFNARRLDEAVQNYVKYKNNVSISLHSAAKAREELGIINIFGNSVEIPAIEIRTGLPTKFKLMDKLIQYIYKESVRNLIDEVNLSLKRLPNEAVYNCIDGNIFFSGSLSSDSALNKIISRRFNTNYRVLDISEILFSDDFNNYLNGDKNGKKNKKKEK